MRLGLPIAPVLTPDEFVASPQTCARRTFVQTSFPHLEGAPFAPFPARLSATPAVLRRPAPAPRARARGFQYRAPEPPRRSRSAGPAPVLAAHAS